MGVVAFNVNQTREYSLKRDAGEDKTVFVIGVLSSRLASSLFDSAIDYKVSSGDKDAPAEIQWKMMSRNRQIVKFGVKSWRNFKTESGNDVPCLTKLWNLNGVGQVQGLTDECLDFLKPYIGELAKEIESDNVLTAEDTENFGSPSM